MIIKPCVLSSSSHVLIWSRTLFEHGFLAVGITKQELEEPNTVSIVTQRTKNLVQTILEPRPLFDLVQPIPLGLTFSKVQSSKLERLSCHVSVKRDVRALSFETAFENVTASGIGCIKYHALQFL